MTKILTSTAMILALLALPQMGSAASKCRSLLQEKIDTRYEALFSKSTSHQRTAVTELLAELYLPPLEALNQLVQDADSEWIEKEAHYFNQRISETEPMPASKPAEGYRHYPRKFRLAEEIEGLSLFTLRPGFVSSNAELIRVALVTSLILEQSLVPKIDFTPWEENSPRLRDEVTFHPPMRATMVTGIRTLLQSIGQLSVQRPGDLTDLELVTRLLRPEPGARGLSLTTQHALRLAPAIIGPYAAHSHWILPTIELQNQNLRLTPQYLNYLKATKAQFRKTYPVEYGVLDGTGQGCPVAHCGAEDRSGLQYLNESFLKIFQLIYPVVAAPSETPLGTAR